MNSLDRKQQLILDIQNLLNNHDGVSLTTINPELLDFMDEETLKNIIGTLLDQKESLVDSNTQWLEQFKKNKE